MRKQTRGRQVTQKPIQKILGFTVKASLIDQDGNKTNNNFKHFIEVEDPKYKNDRSLSTRQNVKNRFDAWIAQIVVAEKKADKLLLDQNFDCVILPKIRNQNILIRQW